MALSFINWPAKRQPPADCKSHILGDIESHVDHLPNQYQDKSKITSSHEQGHFLASSIRNQYQGKGGFYLLNNKAAILDNSAGITLADVARAVPDELHGISFSLYLIQSQHDWNKFPIYLADELNSYILGSLCGAEIGEQFDSEIQQATEFCLYLAVLQKLSSDKGVYQFFDYQLQRVLEIHHKHPTSGAAAYLKKWQQNETYKKYLENKLADFGTTSFL